VDGEGVTTPPLVLALRLQHELTTAANNTATLVGVAAADRAYDAIERAQALLEQLRESVE
jgi:hypothetical protein